MRWLETSLSPIGIWDELREARIARYQKSTVAVVVTESVKELPADGWMSLKPEQISFPDSLINDLKTACNIRSTDVIDREESLGIEIVLESRSEKPKALGWEYKKFTSDFLDIKTWSQGQGKRISYRVLMNTDAGVSRCPRLARTDIFQQMGIEW